MRYDTNLIAFWTLFQYSCSRYLPFFVSVFLIFALLFCGCRAWFIRPKVTSLGWSLQWQGDLSKWIGGFLLSTVTNTAEFVRLILIFPNDRIGWNKNIVIRVLIVTQRIILLPLLCVMNVWSVSYWWIYTFLILYYELRDYNQGLLGKYCTEILWARSH